MINFRAAEVSSSSGSGVGVVGVTGSASFFSSMGGSVSSGVGEVIGTRAGEGATAHIHIHVQCM